MLNSRGFMTIKLAMYENKEMKNMEKK